MIVQIPGVEDVREVFRRELSGPEYVVVDDSVLARGLRWIGELVQRLVDWAFPGGVEAGPAPWVPWLLLGAGGLLVFLLIRAVRRGDVRRPGTGGPARTTPTPRGAREWEAWADERAARGEFGSAATGYYQAALRRLDDAGAVRYGAWKTPGDYVDEVDPAWPGRTAFVSFVADFVETAFGTDGPGAESVARLAKRQKSLEVRS